MVEAGPRSEGINGRDRNGNVNLRDNYKRNCTGDQDDGDDVNTFKILVSTDNHLGYNEECPIRGDDSFVSFEEVLQLAQKEQVDFVLLGGDLFHKNKPSRRSMFKCINLLRKYSLGNKTCEFEFLGDPDQTFPHSSFPWANTEDANLNVGMPIFSINGNHDDPTGSDNLCALDILSASGLINFFGKVSQLDEINIAPIVLRKGTTKLCLFGLSSIRDERLHRMFRAGKVNILFPELSQQEKDSGDWFHLMVLHQNHAKHGPTSHIPESFLHPNLDLIIWGHEHEAVERPVHNPTQDFYVLQPGSSVATSLSPGEAAQKNSWIVHIRGDKFKADKVPLETVRPFVFRDVNLFEESKIDRRKPKCREKVKAFCSQIVEEMLDEAKLQHTGNPKQPIDKPLLRLRLHYVTDSNSSFGGSDVTDVSLNGSAGDAPLNVALFGKEFVDRVANAKDLVTLHRRTEQEIREKNALMRSLSSDVRDALTSSIQDNNSTTNLHTTVVSIVKQFFHSADESEHKYKLSVLTETGLSLATQEFVEKEEKAALHSIVGHQIKKTVDYTVGNIKTTPEDEAQFEDELVKYRKDRVAKAKQLYTSGPHNHTTTTDDVSRNVTDEIDVTESQQDAIAELAEALKHHEKEIKKSSDGPAVDLTTIIDSDEQEEFDKVMESTRINSRGASTSSTRGRGRGRGSRAAAKTATASNVKKAPSGNTTLDLTKLAANKTQTKLQVKPEPDTDDITDAESASVFGSRSSKRAVKRPAVVEQMISDDDDNDYDKDTVDQSYQPASSSKRTTAVPDEQSQNVFSRRMTAAMRNNANTTTSSAIFGSQRSGASGNQAKLARRF